MTSIFGLFLFFLRININVWAKFPGRYDIKILKQKWRKSCNTSHSTWSWMGCGCSKKGTVWAELGQRGLLATDRATNSLACISTSALPPVAYEACRCSRVASRGAPLSPSHWTGGHDGIKPKAITKQITEEISRASGSKPQKARATDRSVSPSPFSYIASSHHPSIRGRCTESHRRKSAGVVSL